MFLMALLDQSDWPAAHTPAPVTSHTRGAKLNLMSHKVMPQVECAPKQT